MFFMNISIAQINKSSKDKNKQIINLIKKAINHGQDMVIFAELCLDLDIKQATKTPSQILSVLEKIKTFSNQIAVIIGSIYVKEGKLYNAGFVFNKGVQIALNTKFNQDNLKRSLKFTPLRSFCSFEINCENFALINADDCSLELCQKIKKSKINTIIIQGNRHFKLNDSFYNTSFNIAKTLDLRLIFANSLGFENELFFNSKSFFANKTSQQIFISHTPALFTQKTPTKSLNKQAEILAAICFGLKTYLQKNGFKKITIGLSGGVDSALVAVLSCIVLKDLELKNNLRLVFMPSIYTSKTSLIDAQKLAQNLQTKLEIVPIDEIFSSFLTLLPLEGIAKENIQARIRANILMSIANTDGSIVLSTGNKSELMTGYATIGGDLIGGFAPLKDLFKTQVYELCKFINEKNELIPQNILNKAPSAELKENQKDTDSLPDYEILDDLLEKIMQNKSSRHKEFKRVLKMYEKSAFKRLVAPSGVVLY